MELVVLVKDFANGVNLEELRTTAISHVAAEVSYFVFKLNIAFLTQHADGSEEELFGTNMFFLIDGNDAIREVKQALQFVIIADGQHGMWTAKSRQ